MAKKLISLIIAFALVSGSLGAFAYEGFGKNAYRIYVSPAGSDSAAGSIDAPLNTLQEAQKRVRNILANADGKNKGVMVYLRGGDYPVSEGIKLTREDSGTEKAPVIYRSYPGEKAVLVGGAALNAAHFKPASDNAVVSRITDKTARESVLCINLEEEGFGDIGELYMDGSYTYSSPFPQGPDTNNVELFINGNIMNNARYPNDGYMIISEVLKDSYQVSGMPGAKTDGGDIFGGIEITSEDKRYLQWKNSDCGVLCGYWYYDWADQSLPIKDIDMEKGSISTKLSSRYGTKKGQRFFAYNLPEEIDIPGEYYTFHQDR